MGKSGYTVEATPDGYRALVVTDAWSREAEELVQSGAVDGLVLNYARGFCENSLEFIREGWPCDTWMSLIAP